MVKEKAAEIAAQSLQRTGLQAWIAVICFACVLFLVGVIGRTFSNAVADSLSKLERRVIALEVRADCDELRHTSEVDSGKFCPLPRTL